MDENYNISKLSNHERKLLLKIKGFSKEEGFCMDYEIPEESNITSVFISKQEWIEKTFNGLKEYYWNSSTEQMMDFEEAWEYLEEDLWDEFETENFKVFDTKCVDLLLKDKGTTFSAISTDEQVKNSDEKIRNAKNA